MASARPSLRVSVSGEPGMPVNGQGTAWVFSGRLGCRDLHRSPDRLSRRCFATDGPPDGLFVKKDSVTFQLGWIWGDSDRKSVRPESGLVLAAGHRDAEAESDHHQATGAADQRQPPRRR